MCPNFLMKIGCLLKCLGVIPYGLPSMLIGVYVRILKIMTVIMSASIKIKAVMIAIINGYPKHHIFLNPGVCTQFTDFITPSGRLTWLTTIIDRSCADVPATPTLHLQEWTPSSRMMMLMSRLYPGCST